MNNEAEGGEKACLLPDLDSSGAIIEPRYLVRLGRFDDAAAWHVLVSPSAKEAQRYDRFLPVLAALEGETVKQYRSRLDEPSLRTVAWHVALLTTSGSVVITMPESSAALSIALVDYVRSLLL